MGRCEKGKQSEVCMCNIKPKLTDGAAALDSSKQFIFLHFRAHSFRVFLSLVHCALFVAQQQRQPCSHVVM